jgi:hypothetical protein
MTMGSETGFNFNNLKARLHNKVFLSLLKGDFLLDTFYEIFKKKRTAHLFVKVVMDPYLAQQLKSAYIVTRTLTDYGFLTTTVECFPCEQMGETGELLLRQQRDQQHEKEVKEGSLLKREEGSIEQVGRAVLNHFNLVDQDKRQAEGAFRERLPVGKLEEGEETLTRRYQSKY